MLQLLGPAGADHCVHSHPALQQRQQRRRRRHRRAAGEWCPAQDLQPWALREAGPVGGESKPLPNPVGPRTSPTCPHARLPIPRPVFVHRRGHPGGRAVRLHLHLLGLVLHHHRAQAGHAAGAGRGGGAGGGGRGGGGAAAGGGGGGGAGGGRGAAEDAPASDGGACAVCDAWHGMRGGMGHAPGARLDAADAVGFAAAVSPTPGPHSHPPYTLSLPLSRRSA